MGLSHTVLDTVLKVTHAIANPTYQQYRDMVVNVDALCPCYMC